MAFRRLLIRPFIESAKPLYSIIGTDKEASGEAPEEAPPSFCSNESLMTCQGVLPVPGSPSLAQTSTAMNVRSIPTWLWWMAAPLSLLLVIVIALSFIDEPLRTYAEREMNHRLPAYTTHIGALKLHPMSLSLDLEDVIVKQKDSPDPPIAAVLKMHGSLQWSALLSGHIVTDQSIEHPVIHFTRPQAVKELEGSPEQKQSWQG